MFRSVFGKNLKEEKGRQAAVAAAIEEARAAYRKLPIAEAREPILQLQDQFDEAGADRLELLIAADSAFTSDQFWLREIAEILLRRSVLTETQLSYLLRLALIDPIRLDLWRRIFRECREQDFGAFHVRASEQCAMAFSPFFSPDGRLNWDDAVSRDEAKALFERCLDETADQIINSKRSDDTARSLLDCLIVFRPSHTAARRYLADLVVKQGDTPNPDSLAVVLEALVDSPDDADLALWAGEALLQIPGHAQEGMQMLRRLHAENARNPRFRDALLSAIKLGDDLAPEDVPFLEAVLKERRDDVRALEMLADYYANHMVMTESALRIYRAAAARSPKRNRYLRMMGSFSASRGDWSEVITIFDEIRAHGQETEDILVPLATAYASFDRSDSEALNLYEKAIRTGTRKADIHNIYCRHLYTSRRQAPESVAQFVQTVRDCPECNWAHLGLGAHYLDTGDPGRALDEALHLLVENERDLEAVKLGARALAADFSRRQLAKLSRLSSRTLRPVFEEAYRLVPDAGPIAMGLVRQRIADGVKDEETVRLLGEVCRRNPDVIDLRMARADMMWDLDRKENAVELYRELVERWRTEGGIQLPRGVTPESRRRILLRVAQWLLNPPGPGPADLDVLIEAVSEPDATPEMILGAARSLIDLEIDHPRKAVIIQRASEFAPGDEKLERARAEMAAVAGNPKPALELAVRNLREGRIDERLVELLRSLTAVLGGKSAPGELLDQLRDALVPAMHPPDLLLVASELLASGNGEALAADRELLETLVRHYPRNPRVRRRLAQSLAAGGDDAAAAEIYRSMINGAAEESDLAVELARINLRLGNHAPDQIDVARRAAAARPSDPELVFHLACTEMEAGNYPEASRLFQQILETSPEFHPRVYTVLEHNRSIRTEHGDLFLLLGHVHLKAGRIEQALAAVGHLQSEYQRYLGDMVDLYGRIIDAAPEMARAYIERAILYRLSGRTDEALDDMRRAHQLAPDNTDLLGEYADTMRHKVLADGDSADSGMLLKCAEVYLELGDDLHSYEMVEQLLDRKPQNQQGLHLLARLQLNAGALPNCWRTVRRLKNKGECLPLLQELARAFADAGDGVNASDVLTSAIEVAGPQRELLEQLRSLYSEQARTEAGAPQREKLLGTLSERARGRYDLREQIGTGAMGVVYKAYDRELDEVVCLKILPEHFASDREVLARFRNEAKAARKLAHPNICRIHDIGVEGNRRHISMEYVASGDLRNYLKDAGGRLPMTECLRIVRELGEALDHAHGEGVLHRDIKAANIMLTPTGKVKLSDFGIAALAEAATLRAHDKTSPMVIGTPLYMSPEQFDGKHLTSASDIYSLGCLLYEMLSGSPPFTRGSIPYHHRFTPPPRLEFVPEPVWEILARMLAKDPAERFQSAHALLQTLETLDITDLSMQDTN